MGFSRNRLRQDNIFCTLSHFFCMNKFESQFCLKKFKKWTRTSHSSCCLATGMPYVNHAPVADSNGSLHVSFSGIVFIHSAPLSDIVNNSHSYTQFWWISVDSPSVPSPLSPCLLPSLPLQLTCASHVSLSPLPSPLLAPSFPFQCCHLVSPLCRWMP